MNSQTSIIPLAIFRMAFGFLMTFSMLRFILNGWIEKAYTTPTFHFTFRYFDWIKASNSNTMYIIVISCAISAFCIGLGLFYRWVSISFFILFTYLELIEKSWYLNHYYFVSLIGFLLIWLPANRFWSLDILKKRITKKKIVPMWTITVIKLQLCVVYFFGGLAKLNYDWIIKAQPLTIWLKARTDLPLIGFLFEHSLTPFIFSWCGLLYDLSIPFLLWSKKTKPIAYILVIIFHILTHLLFHIGMFPWLMILGSLIFITEEEWQKWLRFTPKLPSL